MFKSFIKATIILASALIPAIGNCAEPTKTPVSGYPDFAIGGDVSWTTRITEAGKPTYYNGTTLASGTTTIPDMTFDYGLDAIRLRVWVNPNEPLALSGFRFKIDNSTFDVNSTHGYCSKEDMAAMAKTYADRGHRIMVCLHLSDTWADPARQFIPASWASCTTNEQLTAKVVEHVADVLTALRDNNINVAWVQIGNETNTGMLKYKLPAASNGTVDYETMGCSLGSNATETTKNFVNVFAAASAKVKEIYPGAKTVLHLANGHSWNSVNWTLNLLKRAGFSSEICDYVGLSLYPVNSGADYDYTDRWQTDTDGCLEVIGKITSIYGYRTLLCEIGMNNEWSESTTSSSQKDNIARCNTDVQNFTQYLMSKLKDGDEYACDGLFYWAPEVDYLDDYKKGACHDIMTNWSRTRVTANNFWKVCSENSSFPDGGLADFTITPAGIEDVTIDSSSDAKPVYYNLQGVEVCNPAPGNIYIVKRGAKTTKELFR